MNKQPFVSICIPVYNSEKIIPKTLKNILSQSYKNIEIIISDNASTDKTIEVITNFNSNKIRIIKNDKNVGYAKNLRRFKGVTKGKIMFFMAHDDFIINNGLKKTIDIFTKHPQVGAVTRCYYWFSANINIPIRKINPISTNTEYQIIDLKKKPNQIIPVIESLGQLSGLAIRSSLLTQFTPYIFTAHIKPFLEIAKHRPVAYINTPTIAVSTNTSQTRYTSTIYDISPHLTWSNMVKKVFKNELALKRIALNHISKNYLGLIQLKNYSPKPYKSLIRESLLMIKDRPKTILSPKFILIFLLCFLTPSNILIKLTDFYKEKINSRLIK